MPSSPNYKRDYQQEYRTESKRRRDERSMRNKARRVFEKVTGQEIQAGFDIDHVKPLDKGGSNAPSNLRAVPASKNRSFPRNRKAGMK